MAYLTPAGQQGARAHSDPSDVYVIQLEGTKHWRVWATPETRRLGIDRDYTLAELGSRCSTSRCARATCSTSRTGPRMWPPPRSRCRCT